jgi:hypothetical protein
MPPDVPDQLDEYFVEFKAWTEGGQIRAERVNSPQTREPKGEAPRAFRVTVRLNKPSGGDGDGSASVARIASLLPPYEKEFGRMQVFGQWSDNGQTRNVFSTQSFGDTSESWHEAKFLFKLESKTVSGKEPNTVVEFKMLVVFEGDDAWTLKPPTLSIEAEKFIPCEVPLFAGK